MARVPVSLQGAQDKEGVLEKEASRQHAASRRGRANPRVLGDKAEGPVGMPTVVSLFAGCGGSSLGYKMAGYDERLAVEWDANAAHNFKKNFPEIPIYHGDVAALTDPEALKIARLKPGELDVLDGSPPCQGFSMAGDRELTDPRNSLFKEYVRLLKAFRPKALVMENVTGLVRGYMKGVYLEILQELRAAGYAVKGQVMNAKWYEVPQSRERVIIVGVRQDLKKEPSHPKPYGKPITLREALRGVAPEGAPRLSPKYRKLAPLVKPGECAADHDPGKGMQNLVRPFWDQVCFTITKTNNGVGRGTPIHPVENRSLTIPEAKRICSFPDDFILEGSFTERWARLGNSVPPMLMYAIARHIRQKILGVWYYGEQEKVAL